MYAVKHSTRPEAEVAALSAGRHPGVVELVDAVGGVVRTHRVDGRPLSDLGPLAADEVAGVAAAVATTLADLHDLGVVHGGIAADHVLVAADGRIVLCSLGRPAQPADDVAALGRLVAELLAGAGGARGAAVGPGGSGEAAESGGSGEAGESGGSGEAGGPGRAGSAIRSGGVGGAAAGHGRIGASVAGLLRPGRRRHRGRPARLGSLLAPPAEPALIALVAEATAADPARRPTARQVAAAIHQRIPTARLPVSPTGGPVLRIPPAPRSGRTRPGTGTVRRLRATPGWVAAAVAVPLVAGSTSAVLWRSPAPADPVATPPRTSPAGPTTTTTSPAGPTTTTSSPGPVAPPVDTRDAGAAPSPGAGTADPVAERVWPPAPVHFADGVLTIGDVRYEVGRSGDAVVTGDWSCTGQRTVALLRPSTGEVFAFDGWAAAHHDVAARAVARVPGAAALRVVHGDRGGCDDLEVERVGLPAVPVDPGTPAASPEREGRR